MVCASEKYAFEIEIFTFGRGFRTRISHIRVQKRRFHQSMIRQFGQTDFFNRIDRMQPFATGNNRPLAAAISVQHPARYDPSQVRLDQFEA
jgi:hypothetical protein